MFWKQVIIVSLILIVFQFSKDYVTHNINDTQEKNYNVSNTPTLSETELECLALNIYFEARDQNIDSQIAVSMVVLNRMKDPFWPDTICGVVKQGSYSDGTVKINRCQFAWYCDGLSDKPYEQEVWKLVNNVATSSYYLWVSGNDITDGSTNYHAKYITPLWANDYNMYYVTTVGDHLFYWWNTRQHVDFN